VFLPVELIDDNGSTLKECIVKYAKLWNLDDSFIDFINSECDFCNTLVDRIVTGYVEYKNDKCAVACEPYGSFIIEATNRAKKILPFDNISDIKFVDSIKPYRERKVKILNGAHTTSVLLAYSMGFVIVRDMMNDNLLNKFIKTALNDEIIPTINLPKNELEDFSSSVLERFNNPFIDHKLLDISLNSVAKFKARCLPSIIDYYNKFNSLPTHLCLGLAGLIDFYKKGLGNDSSDVLDFFNDSNNSIYDILSNQTFWGNDLTKINGLYQLVDEYYNNIQKLGARKTMELICNE
jgi:tagaturonate reductase